MSKIDLRLGDNINVLKTIPDNSIDSVVTDPPYGIKFMNNKWDYEIPSVELWQEVLRVLKPGGHALVACGTRTQHRMAVNLEDAGFEIRDIVTWAYGSGMPKGLNISKAIEAKEKYGKSNTRSLRKVEQDGGGASYTLIGRNNGILGETRVYDRKEYTAGTENSKQWQGWNTALKPSIELWTLCRKPLSEKTVAENVLKYGTGGINIDECRIEINPEVDDSRLGGNGSWKTDKAAKNVYEGGYEGKEIQSNPQGRFPANLIHDNREEVISVFPNTKSQGHWSKNKVTGFGKFGGGKSEYFGVGKKDNTEGSVARFFKSCEYTEEDYLYLPIDEQQSIFYSGKASPREKQNGTINTHNNHPTVKPVSLMRYLCKLITPPSGTILDPYMGSGSTGIASRLEGFNFIGIEKYECYFSIAKERIDNYKEEKRTSKEKEDKN